MDFKAEGLDSWHRGDRRLFQGHGEAHTKGNGRSDGQRNQVKSTLVIVNQKNRKKEQK